MLGGVLLEFIMHSNVAMTEHYRLFDMTGFVEGAHRLMKHSNLNRMKRKEEIDSPYCNTTSK